MVVYLIGVNRESKISAAYLESKASLMRARRLLSFTKWLAHNQREACVFRLCFIPFRSHFHPDLFCWFAGLLSYRGEFLDSMALNLSPLVYIPSG